MSSIIGFSEVVLNVRDLPAMAEFYQRVLGCERYLPSEDPDPAIVFLRVPGEPGADRVHPPLLALIDPTRHPPAKGKFEPPVRLTSPLNHIAFEIPGHAYESEEARLQSLGLRVTRARFPHMGARALFFRDPEGNTLELICRDRGV